MAEDIECPKCRKVVSFKNAMLFDSQSFEILSIGYNFRCLNCGTEFNLKRGMTIKPSKKEFKEFDEIYQEISEKVINKKSKRV